MKKLLAFTGLLLWISGNNVIAQDHEFCGTDHYYKEQIAQNPEIANQWNNLRQVTNYPQSNPNYRSGEVRIIPVVFHIIHQGGSENISEKSINDMVQRINLDFRKKNSDTSSIRAIFQNLATDCNIEFRLAKIDPNGKCTNGITRYYSTETVDARDNVKAYDRWPSNKYVNIWVVKSIYNWSGTGTILGYATFPGGPATSDGIVMRADVVGLNYRTLTHELGHYFGLYHTFQDGCSGDCKTTGDLICDTPPVNENNFGCNLGVNTCSNDSPDLPDMLENHMDYTDCRIMFTPGQKERIDYFLQNNASRANLYSNSNLVATGIYDTNNVACKPFADFEAIEKTNCSGELIQFSNLSLAGSNPSYKWYFQGGDPSTSTALNPSVRYNQDGNFQVKLVATNSMGKDSVLKTKYITIYPYYGDLTPFHESFDGQTFPATSWNIDPKIDGVGWSICDLTSVSGTKSFYVNNYSSGGNGTYSFILPPADLRGLGEPYLNFYYAHARIDASTQDNLAIYASNDCGQTWSLRMTKNYVKLPSVSIFYPNEFIPVHIGQWRYETVSLSTYGNSKNLLLKFVFNGSAGNNLFIDNINISSALSIDEKPLSGMKIFQSSDEIIFRKESSETDNQYNIEVCDLQGRKTCDLHKIDFSGKASLSLSLDDLGIINSGLYLIKLTNSSQTINTKLFIQK